MRKVYIAKSIYLNSEKMSVSITKEKDWFFGFNIGKGWFAIDLPYVSVFAEVNEDVKN